MPRKRLKRRMIRYSEYKKKVCEQAEKDRVFNRFLTLQEARASFSFFSVQPEVFFGFK